MSDGVRQTVLGASNAAQLIMRIQLFRIDVYGAMKTFARLIQFAALLMNQTQVVMRGRITRIDRGCFQILLERSARALITHDFREIAAQKEEREQQEKRRSENGVKQRIKNERERQAGERRQEKDRDSPQYWNPKDNPHGRDSANGEQCEPQRIKEIPGNNNRIGELCPELRNFLCRQAKPTCYRLQLLDTLRLRCAGDISRLESTEVKKRGDEERQQGRSREHIERHRCQRTILLLQYDGEAASAIEQVCSQGQERNENDCDRQNRRHTL